MVGKTVQMNVTDPKPEQPAAEAAPVPASPPDGAAAPPPETSPVGAAGRDEQQSAPADAEPLSPAGRLLSELLDESIRRGLHAPESFLNRFPPDAIMAELAEEPQLRAKVLTATLHLPAHTAELLKHDVAGAALSTALEAGDTTATEILEAFAPDDRVRQLPWAALWAFVTEGDWWKKNDDTAKQFMLFLLERAQHHQLMDPNVWRDGLTIAKLASSLSRELMNKSFERAASLGASNKPFTGAEIFSLVLPADLIATFETDYLFDRVVLPLARRAHFLVESGSIAPARSTHTDPKATAEASPGPVKAADVEEGWGDALAGGTGKKKSKAKTAG